MTQNRALRIPLPRGWTHHVRSAVVHVISLAQCAAVYTRSWAVDSMNGRVRLEAENDPLREEVAQLREEGRIKDARMARIPAPRRPHYSPVERLEILQLRAARKWSLQQTADAFLVTPETIASWMKRLDEQGANALLQMPEPVNRFPDLVRYLVQRLKVLCPTMGKVKIAETLARAGLHLGKSTVGRMLQEKPTPRPCQNPPTDSGRAVTSKRPNHVWLVDLTTVPIGNGFWCSWFPGAVPQRWPFCHWLAVVVDHFSRRVQGFAIFDHQPDSVEVRQFLGRTIHIIGSAPRHLISDKGPQFWPSKSYRRWCRRHDIRPRFGAIGKQGSIAIMERVILTTKQILQALPRIPLRRRSMREELTAVFGWYNQDRPHTSLAGRTPDEVYSRRRPANRQPRLEPRARWPRASPCARPQTLVAGQPGDRFTITVGFHAGRRNLPVVSLQRAA